MMDSKRKKIIALIALSIVWGGLLWWQISNWGEPVRVPLTNVSGGTAGTAQSQNAQNGGETLHVQLNLLAAARNQREMPFAAPRNIFALPSSITNVSQSLPPDVADLAARQQAVTAELAQFRYLGFVRTGEEWQKKQDLAVLTKNDDLHVVKKGETVENHVIVKTITQESVTLQDRDSHVEYTVLLSEEPVTQ
jgi:hypothetical protein